MILELTSTQWAFISRMWTDMQHNGVGKIKSIVYHPAQEFHQPIKYHGTRCYRILAGQSSLGKLGGRVVKTSALVSRKSWVQSLYVG